MEQVDFGHTKKSDCSSEDVDGGFEVAMCDGVDDLCFSDFRKGDEADGAGFEFFIAAEFFHDGGGGYGVGECQREFEMGEEFENA